MWLKGGLFISIDPAMALGSPSQTYKLPTRSFLGKSLPTWPDRGAYTQHKASKKNLLTESGVLGLDPDSATSTIKERWKATSHRVSSIQDYRLPFIE